MEPDPEVENLVTKSRKQNRNCRVDVGVGNAVDLSRLEVSVRVKGSVSEIHCDSTALDETQSNNIKNEILIFLLNWRKESSQSNIFACMFNENNK